MSDQDQTRELLEAFVACAKDNVRLQATSPLVVAVETLLRAPSPVVSASSSDSPAAAPRIGLTLEQQAMRLQGIGSSESPMLIGVSPFGGPIDLYMRKVGLWDEPVTDAQLLGHLLEDGIAQWYALTTGARLTPGTTLRHRAHPWFMATPDRHIGSDALLEIKLVGKWMGHHWRDDADGAPEYVVTQVQHQMEVCDVDRCDVVALIDGTTPRVYQVERDREIGAALIDLAGAFWFDHVIPGVPPPVDGTDAARELLAKLYPKNVRPMLDVPPEAVAWVARLRGARGQEVSAKAERELAEQSLKTLIGDAEGMKGSDWSITWRADAKGSRRFLFNDHLEKIQGKAA